MCIDKEQIRYNAFLDNEIKTLGIISGLTPIRNAFPELSSKAEILHGVYKGKNRREFDMEFGCEIKIEVENRRKDETSFFLEAILRQEYSEAVYQLSICKNNGCSKDLIRKFHFDYDPKSYSSSEKRAKYHLQYGGRPTPELSKQKISTESLQDWLSPPRLPIAPVNLALFLDLVFCEFPSTETVKIIENDEWRKMIVNNEKLILKPYYKSVSTFVQGTNHKSTYLFRDFIYGE